MSTFALSLLALVALSTGPVLDDERGPRFDHVIMISVDGLRSDALLSPEPEALPAFRRLRAGSSTLNARTDPAITLTLPNHVSMVTGRHMLGPEGHGCTWNKLTRGREVLRPPGEPYVASVFDVAHDHGVFTGVFVTKLKLVLFDQTWNALRGGPDRVPPDHGRDKIDRFVCVDDKFEGGPAAVTDAVLTALAEDHERSLIFVHYRSPDTVGHARGWDLTRGSPYLESIARIDAQLGRLFDTIEATDGLRDRTAIILTSDHGGGAPHKSHKRPEMWVNYIIPFLVWLGDDAPAVELYEHNASVRRDPGLGRPGPEAALPPIRNGDAANLALHLLGLSPVPGSTINAAQELRGARSRPTGDSGPAGTIPAP